MEQLAGGGGTRLRHRRSPPSSERFLGLFPPPPQSSSPPVELSEHDIFTTSSGSSSRSQAHPYSRPGLKLKPYPDPDSPKPSRISHGGIFAALNDNRERRPGPGSNDRPVFNHKVSTSSISPADSNSSGIVIPRRPPPAPDRVRFQQHSAPVNVPVVPAEMQRRARDFDDVVLEEEALNDEVILPPHEVVASRHSPMLACSVLEGAGRTLKGRDLRQVRNAIWRKTGFLD